MRIKFKVSDFGQIYLPKALREDGFQGELEGIVNHFTLALVKPGSKLEDIKRSLKVLLRALELEK